MQANLDPRFLSHPLLSYHLGRLRDQRTDATHFRRHLHAAARALAHEAARHLPQHPVEITTPLEVTTAAAWDRPLIFVPILRAGLGLLHGFLEELPWAKVGHLGMARNETTLEPEAYYARLPEGLDQADVWVLDPMLATGGSASAALATLKQAGAKHLVLCCLVGAPEGIRRLEADHPDVRLHLAAVDRCLNERGFILPGLGDAGDRYFGTV